MPYGCRTDPPRAPNTLRQVMNLVLMDEAAEHDAPRSNSTSGTPAMTPKIVELDSVYVEANGADEEASSPGGPTPIVRVRRPSYSRFAAPPAALPSSRPRTRRATHDLYSRLAAPPAAPPSSRPRTRRATHDLAYGRARIEGAKG